jgi:hypothetical protein
MRMSFHFIMTRRFCERGSRQISASHRQEPSSRETNWDFFTGFANGTMTAVWHKKTEPIRESRLLPAAGQIPANKLQGLSRSHLNERPSHRHDCTADGIESAPIVQGISPIVPAPTKS